MLRRAVATIVNKQASVNLAAELLGYTDPNVTIEHHMRRHEHMNPLTAELLDEALAGPSATWKQHDHYGRSITLPLYY